MTPTEEQILLAYVRKIHSHTRGLTVFAVVLILAWMASIILGLTEK